MTRHRTCVAALAGLCALAAGCGGERLGAVTGTVTYDGKPVPQGTITFEAPGKRPATARIENGQIVEPTTFKPGDGVPVGSHTVAISAHGDSASAVAANPGEGKAPRADYMSGASIIPARYNNPGTSGLTAEVKEGVNVLDFKLDAK